MKAYVVKGFYRDLKPATDLLKKRIGEEELIGASMGFLYYPYWLINFDVKVIMILGITKTYDGVYLMVDGITGFVGYCSKPDIVTEDLDEERVLSLKVLEDAGLNGAKEYVKKTFQRLKKLTMLKEMEITLVDKLVIYKQFWLVRLPDKKNRKVWLLLDSVSGATQFVVPSDIGMEVSSAR
ncbi:MAG: hypothetical protein N3D12_00220 [Candidatus Methanomethyliaceae archaeon]|nr:hypothetical protein [Candidatus Methanomethyliaceae archaeon]